MKFVRNGRPEFAQVAERRGPNGSHTWYGTLFVGGGRARRRLSRAGGEIRGVASLFDAKLIASLPGAYRETFVR